MANYILAIATTDESNPQEEEGEQEEEDQRDKRSGGSRQQAAGSRQRAGGPAGSGQSALTISWCRCRSSSGIGAENALPALSMPNLQNVGEYLFLQYLEEMVTLVRPSRRAWCTRGWGGKRGEGRWRGRESTGRVAQVG